MTSETDSILHHSLIRVIVYAAICYLLAPFTAAIAIVHITLFAIDGMMNGRDSEWTIYNVAGMAIAIGIGLLTGNISI